MNYSGRALVIALVVMSLAFLLIRHLPSPSENIDGSEAPAIRPGVPTSIIGKRGSPEDSAKELYIPSLESFGDTPKLTKAETRLLGDSAPLVESALRSLWQDFVATAGKHTRIDVLRNDAENGIYAFVRGPYQQEADELFQAFSATLEQFLSEHEAKSFVSRLRKSGYLAAFGSYAINMQIDLNEGKATYCYTDPSSGQLIVRGELDGPNYRESLEDKIGPLPLNTTSE